MSSYLSVKRYLEQKYPERAYLKRWEVDLETLGEAHYVDREDGDTDNFLISDVAKYVCKDHSSTHAKTKQEIIHRYQELLTLYWRDNGYLESED